MKLSYSNLVKNPRPSGSDLGSQALSMLGEDGDDDDDDFQNPSQAVTLSQSPILSSLKSSKSQPLKLSNGCRSRKRLKPCTAIGKENESVPKKQSSVSRVSKDVQAKIPVITKRKDLCHKISPVGSGNMDIAIGCFEEDGIEDQKSNLSAPDALNLGEYWPHFEKISGKGSQHLLPVEANIFNSVVSVSSNFDSDCSDVCTNNVELGKKLRHSCDLEKNVAMCVSEYAYECNVYDETKSGEARLASKESRLPEYCPEIKTDVQILNHSVDQRMMEDKVEISSEASFLKVKEKSISSEQREYSSEIDGCNESNLIRKFQEPKVLGKGPIGGMQSLSTGGCEPEIVLLNNIKQNKNTRSIEAKLLDSSERLVSCNIRDGCVEADGFEEFLPGTQLNMLIDLCCEMDDQGCSGSEMASFEHINLGSKLIGLEMNLLVECPLCQADITKLSEEMRQIHTNECLDKDDTTEESVPIEQAKSNPCQQIVDTNPVLEWLRALDLCRYEDVFMREEIDWDTLQWLTEEDLISIGVVALGPRKKIIFSLNELHKRNSLAPDGESDSSNAAANEKKKISLQGNKLITEYFHGPSAYKVKGSIPVKLFHNAEKASKGSIQKKVGDRRYANCGKLREIPPWCCISGTPFRVDAFRHLRGDCSHWFLTHFHMDHYQGLTKNFCYGKIYCSKVTAHLVNMKIGVPWDRIQILPINETICIAGVNLTCLDANHCPGSIIILFEPSNNKAILHTGDFRFSPEMAGSSLLQSSHIHTLILDTTYCNPQYDFPKQVEVVQFVIDAIQAEAFNPKTLFLIGTYTIGKEKLFLEAARTLKMKVYVGAGKLHLLKCLDLPEEDMHLLTENEMESNIHVVPMWTIASFKRMKHISNQYMGRYNLIVAFSPTGWTFGKGKKKTPGRRWQQGTVIRYEVPYSEHCSFTELKDFVRFISPENIIPSVNNEGPESVDAMLSLLLS